MTLVLPGGNYAGAETFGGARPTVEGPIDMRIRVSGEWDSIVGGGIRRLVESDVITCALFPNWDSLTGGEMHMSWGNSFSYSSNLDGTVPLPFMGEPGTYWLRFLATDDGAGNAIGEFFWSATNTDDPDEVNWVLHETVTPEDAPFTFGNAVGFSASVGDGSNNTEPWCIHAARAEFGATVVANPVFSDANSAPFFDSTGNEWTLVGDAYLGECPFVEEDPDPSPGTAGGGSIHGTYSGGSYAGFPYGGTVGAASVAEGAIELAPAINENIVPGPHPLFNPEIDGPVHLDSVYGMPIVPGPYVPALTDLPPDLGDPVPPPPRLRLREVDSPPLAIQCQPTLNDVGSGSFTLYGTQTVPLHTPVTFEVGSTAVFTGRVSRVRETLLSPGEEADYVTEYDVSGMLESYRNIVVFPEFGATDPIGQMGQPTQDERIMDWHSRQHRLDSAENHAALSSSASIAATFGPNEPFPIPDVWPWPYTQWIWGTNPSVSARRGWCFFRAPFNYPYIQKAHVWLVAHDYAELAVDGVPILECDTPGQAKRVELELRPGSHLITMRAFNEGGRAAVMVAVLGLTGSGQYRLPPATYSNSMWRCLAYPTRSFHVNPGHLLHALRDEAIIRGAEGAGWHFSFTRELDSAGRPWPVPPSPIVVRVGSTNLDVLHQLVDEHIDFAVAPNGRTLHAWVKDRGTGISRDLPWTQSQDLLEHSVERR